jgi:hypothetical protein
MERRLRIPLVMVGLLAMWGCGASPPRAAEVVVPQSDGWWPPAVARTVETALVRTPAVEAAALRGIIINGVDGTPLAGASVWVAGTEAGAVTDARGTFRLDGPGGRRTIEVRLLGYEEFRAELDFDAAHGYAARIALMPVPVTLCISPLTPPSALVARVREALTGAAPALATLEMAEGTFRRAASGRAAPGDSALVLRIPDWRPGRYRVTVSAPGHLDWRHDDVVVGVDGCGTPTWPVYDVWLMPAGEPVDG